MRRRTKLIGLAAVVLVIAGTAGFIAYRQSAAYHIAVATGDGDAWDRRSAMGDLLNKRMPETAIPVFIKLLGDKESIIRVKAADYLGFLEAKSAVEPLLAALPQQSPSDRPSFYRALGAIGDPRAIGPLLAALSTAKDEEEARAITSALAKLGPEVVPALIERLASPVPEVRGAAASGLGWFWREGDAGVKKQATTAMQAAVEPLIRLLKDTSPAVRRATADAMGNIREPRFLAPLVAALDDRDDTMHDILARVISYYGDDAIAALRPAFQSADAITRRGAAEALAALVDRSHYDISQRDKPYVRRASEILDEALRRNDLLAGAGAFEYYIRQGRGEAIPFLIAALDAHGHRRMGNALLNCGQKTLEDAAKAWATRNGFTIGTTPGPRSNNWGKR